MKVSDAYNIIQDCLHLRAVLVQKPFSLTDEEKEQIRELLWDFKEELLNKEVK